MTQPNYRVTISKRTSAAGKEYTTLTLIKAGKDRDGNPKEYSLFGIDPRDAEYIADLLVDAAETAGKDSERR